MSATLVRCDFVREFRPTLLNSGVLAAEESAESASSAAAEVSVFAVGDRLVWLDVFLDDNVLGDDEVEILIEV